jgi:MFS family permease
VSTSTTTQSSRLIKATPFFYGWVILIVGTLGIIMIGPSQTFTIAVFIDSFIDALGISRANLSLVYGLATLGASLMLPLTGRLVDRHGSRRMVLIVAFIFGLATIGTALVKDTVTIALAFLALRFFGFGSLQLVSNNVIAQWFIRRRGLAMGLAGLSLAAGFTIFPALTEYLIGQFTWRGAWLALGLLVWGIMLPLGWLFFRDKPELYGLLPDGDQRQDKIRQQVGRDHQADIQGHFPLASQAQVNEENWTLAEARRTGAFWLFLVALSSLTMLVGGLVFHHLSLFEVRGLSRDLAVDIFKTVAFFSVVGNLAMGRLLDKFSARRLMALTLLMLVAAMILVQIMATPVQALVYGALLGLITGSYRVIDAVIWAKYFGRRYLGSIRGATMIGVVGGTALGAYPLGLSLDYLGSYTPVLTALLVLPLGSSLITFFIKPPQKQATSKSTL